jgi:predicted lipase
VIVAFRGTEIRKDFQSILADIMTDFDILMVPCDKGGKVHRVFRRALDEVWREKLLPYIRSQDNGDRTIWFTGHSLGAALATLAADRYGNVRGLYTFGSPRVGDESFKRRFRIDAYRVVNNNDIVSRVPPKGVYRHLGDLKYIDGEGTLHGHPDEPEPVVQDISREIAFLFNSGRTRSGLAFLTPDCITDHVPLLYATHLWNNIRE